MPIFMDRHDVSEMTTAENVAQLHQEDLKIQRRFGCRGLTYWFDDKRKTAFCLIEATDKNAIKKMHSEAHGEVPNQIIEVDPSIVESFLGRIEDPEKAKNTDLNIINDPAFRTIMLITFERPTKGVNSRLVKSSIGDYHQPISEILTANDGKLVKHNESSFLVSFKSVSKAVQAGNQLKTLLSGRTDSVNDKVVFKVALSAGVPVTESKLFFEDAIKLAERMCKVVDGEIIISSEVKELYNSENSKPLQEAKSVRCLSPAEEKFLNDLLAYTELHFTSASLKMDNISKSLGYSRSQLYRTMIILTGQSPNSFIKDYRLCEAIKLLDKKRNNISEIAFETGFTSLSYFSKCFHKKYGYLPSDHLPDQS
jgi:AraC-like DNA-binding protein